MGLPPGPAVCPVTTFQYGLVNPRDVNFKVRVDWEMGVVYSVVMVQNSVVPVFKVKVFKRESKDTNILQ